MAKQTFESFYSDTMNSLNEARSINKIQNEYLKVTSIMKDTLESLKEAKDTEKEDLLTELKTLTISKKKLELELDDAVGIKDAGTELANESIINEGTMSEIHAIVNAAKDLESFLKKFFSEFGDKIKKTADTIEWAKTLYVDAKSMKLESNEPDVNERNITTKRKYTDMHPAKTVGKSARIRNKMLEAIKDRKITQAEFDMILKEMSKDSNRWMKKKLKDV
jgi:hypothetical protein